MQEKAIDLRYFSKAIKNRRNLIGSIFVGSIISALLLNYLIPPTFEAETTLRIKQPKGLLSSSLLTDVTGTQGNAKQVMSTYAEILKSRTVVQQVIDKIHTDKEQAPTYEEMLKRIKTQPIKDTEIVKVKASANSATEAQLIANSLVESFTARLTYLVSSEQSAVRGFIGERVVEARQDLNKAEKNLEQYKRDEKILTPSDETRAMVERMASMKKMLADNAVAAAIAGAKLNSTEQQLAQESPGMVADSPMIQLYKAKLADGEVELVSLSQNYGEKHPKVVASRAAIDETRAKLAYETSQVINANAPSTNPIHQGLLLAKIQNEAELAAARSQKAAIQRVMADSEKEVAKLPGKEQGISRLTRDVMVAQEIYIMLAKRYEEARISEVAQPLDIQVIDVAIAPEEGVLPNKEMNVLVGAILGLLVGGGIAMFLEFSRRTITTSHEAKEYLGLPVLGVIPDFNLEKIPAHTGPITRIQALLGKKTRFTESKS